MESVTTSKPDVDVLAAPFDWAKDAQYSQAVRVGDLVFSAGQGGFDESGELVPGGFAAQARQTFRNLATVLEAHGASLASVVKLSVHLAETADYDLFKQVRTEFLHEPWPASTAVAAALLVPGMLVEIDAIAVVAAPRARG